jgi:hypothetical protein
MIKASVLNYSPSLDHLLATAHNCKVKENTRQDNLTLTAQVSSNAHTHTVSDDCINEGMGDVLY